MTTKSYSQHHQDEIALAIFGNNKFFIDIGFCDGESGSNTYLLEQNGWAGIGADPFPNNYDFRNNTKVCKCVVFSSEQEVIFKEAGAVGGIESCLDAYKNNLHVVQANSSKHTSITLEQLLCNNNAPKYIEYLSIDTEGSEYEILKGFPFDKYLFGMITTEHNTFNNNHPNKQNISCEMSHKRKLMYDLLSSKGYILLIHHSIEDFYLHATIFNKLDLNTKKKINQICEQF
jgi:hypothetical protein